MKQGWQIVQIGDIAKVFNGNSINANEKKERYEGLSEGYPFIATKDVSTDGVVDYYNGVKIPYDTDLKIAKPDTVFVCAEGGSAGRKVAYIDRDVCFGNKLFAIEPRTKIVIGQFLYYVVQHSDFKKQFRSLMTGIIGGVSIKKFNAINIILPPLSDQQHIVTLLDAEFAKIDALKANAERNLQNAKDLFQAALKKELEPKEGWKVQTLKEVSDEMFAGGDAPKDNMSKDITSQYQIPIYANAVEKDGLYGYTNVARVTKPSITIAGRGSGTGYVLERNEAYLPIVRLIVVLPNEQIIGNRYLYYAIRSLNIKPNGSAIPQLTIPMIADYPIPYPNIEKQSQIVARLDTLNENCKTLQANYEKTIALCDDLKQALLRKAFNGEI